MKQHLFVVAKIAGTTSSPRQTAFPMKLSNSELYILNISNSKQFTNKYWDDLGEFSSVDFLSEISQQNNKPAIQNNEDHSDEEGPFGESSHDNNQLSMLFKGND